MAITVTRTTPVNNSTDVYTDYSIFIEFDKAIEGSYLNIDYFKIYRTNQPMTEFYEAMDLTVSQNGSTVEINPSLILVERSYYVVIVTGGTEGIRSLDNDTLDSNVVISYMTGNGVGPLTNVNINTNPSVSAFENQTGYANYLIRSGEMLGSTDVFTGTNTMRPISFVGSIPENKSVGITSVDRLILYYNDLIDSGSTIPPNSYGLKVSTVPIDNDPFVNNILSGDLSVYQDQLIFDTTFTETTTNREFTFRIQPLVVRGVTMRGRDPRAHVIKFMGPLSPVFATPDQIIRRLVGYGINSNDIDFEYDLWKVIHEVSLYVSEIYADLMNTASINIINRLTICLVLRELLMRGAMFEGGIKMRQLLATKVEYMATDWGAVSDELDRCVNESLPASSGISSTIMINVKSGNSLMNMRGDTSKLYGVHR